MDKVDGCLLDYQILDVCLQKTVDNSMPLEDLPGRWSDLIIVEIEANVFT